MENLEEHLQQMHLKRNDPDSPCFVELSVYNTDENAMAHGIFCSPTEAVYHMLFMVRSDQEIAKRPHIESRPPANRFLLFCYPARNMSLQMSGRFNRARVDRVLPELGDRADWSLKESPLFKMQRPRRKNTYGRRFPKRDAFMRMSTGQIERRLRTNWYFKKPLIVTVTPSVE